MITVLEFAGAVVAGAIVGVLPVKVYFDRDRRQRFKAAVADVPIGTDPDRWREQMLAIYDPNGRHGLGAR